MSDSEHSDDLPDDVFAAFYYGDPNATTSSRPSLSSAPTTPSVKKSSEAFHDGSPATPGTLDLTAGAVDTIEIPSPVQEQPLPEYQAASDGDRRMSSSSKNRYFVDPNTPSGPKCYNCNETGHIARECPKSRYQITCYECGAAGHMARDCTVRKVSRASLPSMGSMNEKRGRSNESWTAAGGSEAGSKPAGARSLLALRDRQQAAADDDDDNGEGSGLDERDFDEIIREDALTKGDDFVSLAVENPARKVMLSLAVESESLYDAERRKTRKFHRGFPDEMTCYHCGKYGHPGWSCKQAPQKKWDNEKREAMLRAPIKPSAVRAAMLKLAALAPTIVPVVEEKKPSIVSAGSSSRIRSNGAPTVAPSNARAQRERRGSGGSSGDGGRGSQSGSQRHRSSSSGSRSGSQSGSRSSQSRESKSSGSKKRRRSYGSDGSSMVPPHAPNSHPSRGGRAKRKRW